MTINAVFTANPLTFGNQTLTSGTGGTIDIPVTVDPGTGGVTVNLDIPENRDVLNFIDAAQISSWAGSAVQSMSPAGVLSGCNNAFNPLNTATRAEVAAMFRNFMRFVVAVNDDGTDETRNNSPLSPLDSPLYIDRRAMEAIERALKAAGNDDEDENMIPSFMRS